MGQQTRPTPFLTLYNHLPRIYFPAKRSLPGLRVFNVYVCIRCYAIGCSFEPIFIKFTRLVRVHSWVNPIVFGNNRPNRTTDMGGNVPPKPVFRVLSQPALDSLRKKLKNCIWYPISPKKDYTHFCHPTPRPLKNSHAPKNNFSLLF